MVMVPDDWRAFIANTMAQVRSGAIPMARIDDAVSRIVRVKLRLGRFDRRPSQRPGAGDAALLQSRELARRAVRESLVLLKNNHGVLPLKPGSKLLVVGNAADSLPDQAGGWSLSWQGTGNGNADFPNGETLLAGIRAANGAGQVTYSANGRDVDLKAFDAIIAVLGETPYAETMGDIIPSATMRHSDRQPQDLAVLQTVAAAGKPVVAVFLSGRPLYVNNLLNLSDAFVAAWLPGTEGGGVADVLFADANGHAVHDFRGTLAMPWPGVACPDAPAGQAPAARWLFHIGYGLRYAAPREVPELPEQPAVVACAKASSLSIFRTLPAPPYALFVAPAAGPAHDLGADLNAVLDWPQAHPALRVRTVQVNTQQDAKAVTWLGAGRFYAQSPQPTDLGPLLATAAALQFDVVVNTRPTAPVMLYMGCGGDCVRTVDVTRQFAGYAPGQRQAVSIPLRCFGTGAQLAHVDVPFGVRASAPFAAAFANVRIVAADAAPGGDAAACPGK
jgi:beta-glucosidase